MLQRLAVVVAALVPFASSGADQPSGPAPPSCSGESHRQFDFWLGEWTVTQNGKPAGESRIERVLDGCALLEHWSGTSGYTGKSLNFYDRSRGVWHQTWIDHRGSPLYLEGSFANGRMTLTGVQTDPE